jgi:hypothetical protein
MSTLPSQRTGSRVMSMFLRGSSQPSRPRGVPRSAEVVLAAFARANRGLFILDGPAIGSDPTRRGDELDVYCLFDAARTPEAINTAKNALNGMPGVKVAFHAGADFAGSLLNYLGQRGKVIGERRLRRR